MKKAIKKATIILVVLLVICIVLLLFSCILGAQLLKKESLAPKDELITQCPVSLAYSVPQTEFVLVEEPINMMIYPETEMLVRSIPKGELLEVLAEAFAGDTEWLLVQMRDLKSPSDLIGWVEKGKTRLYDDSMSRMVISPILLPAGTKVYPNYEGHLQTNNEQVQYASAYGRAVKREGDFILLEIGGELVWAEENTVVIGRP